MRAARGFTPIELLIVVAIIAILAAIAVPNFLEAQVRSKVSRAKSDMRSLATAVESYRVDANLYPIPADEFGNQVPLSSGTLEAFDTRISALLTTPVAYITSRPVEPFPAKADPESPMYHFCTRAYFEAKDPDPEEFDQYVGLIFGAEKSTIEYYIQSHGPDLDHDSPEVSNFTNVDATLYDPTNGTTSSGDVIYWGPGTGFKN